MASPSPPRDRSATPVVPSVHMASPTPLRFRNNLSSMEVDCILTLVGSNTVGLLPSERRDRAWLSYQEGHVVHTCDGWDLYWAI